MAEILRDGLTFQKLAEYVNEFHGGCMEGLPGNDVTLVNVIIETQHDKPVFGYNPQTDTFIVYGSSLKE